MTSVATARPDHAHGTLPRRRIDRPGPRGLPADDGDQRRGLPGRAEPGGAYAVMKAYRLSKPDGTAYDVARTNHGLTCDCPDFIFHRDGLDPDGCKHIKAMVAYGLLDRKE